MTPVSCPARSSNATVPLEDIGEELDAFPRAPELGLNPAQEAQIVATLTEHGYPVRRDDEFFATLECYL